MTADRISEKTFTPEQPKTEPAFNSSIFPDQITKLKNNENGVVDFLKKVYEEGYKHEYEEDKQDSAKKIIEYVIKNQEKINSFFKDKPNSSFKDESQQSQFLLDLLKSTSSNSDNEDNKEERLTFISDLKCIGISEIISFPNETDKKDKIFLEKIRYEEPDFILSLIDNKDKFFDKEGNLNSNFYEFSLRNSHSVSTPPENLLIFSDQDKAMWSLYKDLYLRNQGSDFDNFFITNRSKFSNTDDPSKIPEFLDQYQNHNFHFNSRCIEALFSAGINFPAGFIFKEDETLEYYFNKYRSRLCSLRQSPDEIRNFFLKNTSHIHEFLDQDQNHNFHVNSHCLESLMAEGIDIPINLFYKKNLESFSDQDKAIWTFLRDNRTFDKFIIKNKNNFNKYIVDNNYTFDFFNEIKINYNNEFVNYFKDKASKGDWIKAFGEDTISPLLKSLPEKTNQNNEARNAFTHNKYDRTSLFFKFLIENPATNFVLDKEDILIASAYIKKFKLSTTPIIFKYFKNITQFNDGKITSLDQECIDSNVTTIDQLQNKVNNFKKKCISSKPFENFKLSPLELELLSVATGHSSTQWTRTPIETIIRDFSKGNISPLSPEFIPSSTQVDEVQINNTVDLTTNEVFQTVSQEVLNSIQNINTIDDLKKTTTEILESKLTSLSKKYNNIVKKIESEIDFFKKNNSELTKEETEEHEKKIRKRIEEPIKKQQETLELGINTINNVNSIDEMVKVLLTSSFSLDQNRYNSILRQLVFRKVLQRKNTSDYSEMFKNSLENNPGVLAITESSNFLKNSVEDHVLDLTKNNEEKYWDEDSFIFIKNNEKVFKKNLDITSLTKGLDYIFSQFKIINLQSKLDIEMIPDRGLIGEMAGYMADVCYTKVYPLLRRYPNVVPYKFVSSPNSDNPEIIGSTLVFQVKTKEDEPALLIRAFNIPNESNLDIGQFFEKFVDSLSGTAKKLGIKKIIAAGTDGTISNYEMAKQYVIDKYVFEQKNTLLKENFDFNNDDITNECYLVRDLTQ